MPPYKPGSFANGASIGSGLAFLLTGALIALSLNGYYWEQTARLAGDGLSSSAIHSALLDIAFVISLGAFIAIFGVYLLVLGSLNQFSPSLRQALERKEHKARFGTNLLSGGIFFIAIISLNFVNQLYSPLGTWLTLFNIGALVVGLILAAIGAVLLANFYATSRKLATKV